MALSCQSRKLGWSSSGTSPDYFYVFSNVQVMSTLMTMPLTGLYILIFSCALNAFDQLMELTGIECDAIGSIIYKSLSSTSSKYSNYKLVLFSMYNRYGSLSFLMVSLPNTLCRTSVQFLGTFLMGYIKIDDSSTMNVLCFSGKYPLAIILALSKTIT